MQPTAKRKKREEKKRKKLQTKLIDLDGFGTSSPPSNHYTTEVVIPKSEKFN